MQTRRLNNKHWKSPPPRSIACPLCNLLTGWESASLAAQTGGAVVVVADITESGSLTFSFHSDLIWLHIYTEPHKMCFTIEKCKICCQFRYYFINLERNGCSLHCRDLKKKQKRLKFGIRILVWDASWKTGPGLSYQNCKESYNNRPLLSTGSLTQNHCADSVRRERK